MGVQKQPRWNVAGFFFYQTYSHLAVLHVYEYPYHKSKLNKT